MCDKTVDDNADALEFLPDQYGTKEMCIKSVDDYVNTLEFVPGQYKTQEMCDKLFPKILC